MPENRSYNKAKGQLKLLNGSSVNNLPYGWTLKDYKEEKKRLQKIINEHEILKENTLTSI